MKLSGKRVILKIMRYWFNPFFFQKNSYSLSSDNRTTELATCSHGGSFLIFHAYKVYINIRGLGCFWCKANEKSNQLFFKIQFVGNIKILIKTHTIIRHENKHCRTESKRAGCDNRDLFLTSLVK